ncbi:MAG: aminoacyl--tRNA ligase-related protein [Candidatus Aenigmatarchaeota archaeon]
MTELEKKENFSEWYNQIVRKAEIIDDRFPVKGMPSYPHYGFCTIKNIFSILEKMLDKEKYRAIWMPILIPKEIFQKEEEHIQGFGSEVFYVKPSNPLEEEKEIYYILRPTSETELYYMFSLWISSYRDLPLLTYMTNTVYRYETKATKPLIRGREILWVESHTAHKDIDDAYKNIKKSMEIYSNLFWNVLSIPHVWVVRPDWDKFAGAQKTFAADTILADGKFLQIGTTHMLGQNFSKAFNIKFQDRHPYVKISENIFEAKSKNGEYKFIINIFDNTIEIKFYEKDIEKAKILDKIEFSGEISEDNEELIEKINKILEKHFPKEFLDLDNTKYVWQTCFGVSMRLLAAVIGIHGDENGLILPFSIAPIQIIIIPIYYSESERNKILDYCKKIENILSNKYRVEIDDRDDKTPGWKFNYWEMKGVPIRIEIGFKEFESETVTVCDRLTKKRKSIHLNKIEECIQETVNEMDLKLKERSKKFFEESIIKVTSIEDLKSVIENKKVAKIPFCLNEECGKKLKNTLNIDVRGYDIIPEVAEDFECIICKNKAKYWCYAGKSY